MLFSFSSILRLGAEVALGIIELLQMTFFVLCGSIGSFRLLLYLLKYC